MPRLENFRPHSYDGGPHPEDSSPEEGAHQEDQESVIAPDQFLTEYFSDPDAAVEDAFQYIQRKLEDIPHGTRFGVTEFWRFQKSPKDTLLLDLFAGLPDEETPLTISFGFFERTCDRCGRGGKNQKFHSRTF